MSFTAYILFTLRLLKLKTDGHTICTEKLQFWNQNSHLLWVSLIDFEPGLVVFFTFTQFYISALFEQALLLLKYFLLFSQDVHVVLLCPSDLDSTLRILLQVPLWSQRVTYLKGSALIDEDLIRARYELAISD